MSAGTQPATPEDLPDYEPVMLQPEHIEALSVALNEWLIQINKDRELPKKVILTNESAKQVENAIKQFLEKIKTYISLKEKLIHHP